MTYRQNTLKMNNSCPYAVSRGSFEQSSKISGSDVRQLAIELVKQAYNTGDSSTKSYQNAKILDKIIAQSFVQQYGKPNEGTEFFFEADTPVRDLYIDQMVRVAHHLSQRTYIGFYSILFNQMARNIEGQVGKDFLESLPGWTLQDFFPELYNNQKLTIIEKAGLQQRHIREFTALSNAFRRVLQSGAGPEQVEFFRKCEESNLEDAQMDDLYSQCYNQICVQERFRVNQSLQDASKATYSSPMNEQIIVDDAPKGTMLWTYCLPTKDLLIAVAKDQNNPLIGTPLSSSTINRVKQNFSTELKLIEYVLSKTDIPYSLDNVKLSMSYSS